MKSSADEQVQAGAWFLEAREALAKRAEATNKAEALDSLDELGALAERSRDRCPTRSPSRPASCSSAWRRPLPAAP